MSGYSAQELLGQPHHIVRHPDMPRAAFAQLWSTAGRGRRWSGYVKNLRKDGAFYWVYATVLPMIRDGRIVGYTSVRRTPARRQVEAAAATYLDLLHAEPPVPGRCREAPPRDQPGHPRPHLGDWYLLAPGSAG